MGVSNNNRWTTLTGTSVGIDINGTSASLYVPVLVSSEHLKLLTFIKAFNAVLAWHGRDYCSCGNHLDEHDATVHNPTDEIEVWHNGGKRKIPAQICYKCKCGDTRYESSVNYLSQIQKELFKEPLSVQDLLWEKRDDSGGEPIGYQLRDLNQMLRDMEKQILELKLENDTLKGIVQSLVNDPMGVLRQRLLNDV